MIFDNIIPDMHKLFVHYCKHKSTITKEEIAIKTKKLRSTKKAEGEMDEADRLFYGLMMSFKLDKDQKKEMGQLSIDLEPIYKEYKE